MRQQHHGEQIETDHDQRGGGVQPQADAHQRAERERRDEPAFAPVRLRHGPGQPRRRQHRRCDHQKQQRIAPCILRQADVRARQGDERAGDPGRRGAERGARQHEHRDDRADPGQHREHAKPPDAVIPQRRPQLGGEVIARRARLQRGYRPEDQAPVHRRDADGRRLVVPDRVGVQMDQPHRQGGPEQAGQAGRGAPARPRRPARKKGHQLRRRSVMAPPRAHPPSGQVLR